MRYKIFILVFSFLTFYACNTPDDQGAEELQVLDISIDGSAVSQDVNKVGTSPAIAITFDAAISRARFEEELSVISAGNNPEINITYSNADSKANISLELELGSTYTVQVPASEFGANGQKLANPIDIELSTETGNASACTTTSGECARQISFSNEGVDYTVDYFSTYTIEEPNESGQINNAIILIHGANRNNDDYFNWMNATLSELSLHPSTVVIAPQFKDDSEVTNPSELYWNSNNWRDGDDAGNEFKVSSFTVVDSLVGKLVRNFSLDEIVITGHSSGGLFTHVYGASNTAENEVANLPHMKYLVANSQYFYYPTEERVNEDNNQFFIPTNCSGYDFWPLGFNLTPPYINQYSEEEFNTQFLSRDIHYLLGNGDASDPSLNTDACRTNLLGSSRYNRGENIYFLTEEKFPENNHSRSIVQGIGHNGQAMYQSEEFKGLLMEIF